MDVPQFTDAQVPHIMEKFAEDQRVMWLFGKLFYPSWESKSKQEQLALVTNDMIPRFLRVKSSQDFQDQIFYGFFLESLIANTVDSIEVSGFENLDSSKNYLFMSNHRDIILDPLLFNHQLVRKTSLKPARLVFGDNLMITPKVAAIFGLSNGLVVQRSGSLREMFSASKKLSHDAFQTIQQQSSVWIAQRNGRAKDGRDVTEPAVLKMLYMDPKSQGLSFSQFLQESPIVPYSVSYEWDPCDRMKAWEIYRAQTIGQSSKRKFADLASVIAAIRVPKGRVSIRVGTPISSDIDNPQDAALAIDQQVQGSYRLWKNNYIANDVLTTPRFQDQYTESEKRLFLDRFRGLPEEVFRLALESYQNPLLLQEALLGKCQ